MRQAVEEVGGAVQWVDDPAVLRLRAHHLARLFHEEAELGPRALELVLEDLLGPAIGVGNEIGRTLAAHLELLDLTEIANQPAGRARHGPDHHLDIG